jgi:hypothetical protein
MKRIPKCNECGCLCWYVWHGKKFRFCINETPSKAVRLKDSRNTSPKWCRLRKVVGDGSSKDN